MKLKLVVLGLLLSTLSFAQSDSNRVFNFKLTQMPVIQPNGGFTQFTNTSGTPATAQPVGFNTAGITSSVVFTSSGSEMELSKDGSTGWGSSITYTTSGGYAGTPAFFVRTSGSAAPNTYNGNIIGTGTSAAGNTITCQIPYTALVNSGPLITRSPTTLSGFTSVAGSLGGSQSSTIVGTNLTGNLTAGPLAGYKVSKDNISFATTQTLTASSGSVNQLIYLALSDANTAGTYNGNFPISGGGASTVNIAVTGTTTSGATTPDSARFRFGLTTGTGFSMAGWQDVIGDPSTGVRSGTISGTTITYTTVSTNTANWTTFGGGSAGASNGVTNATIPYSGSTNAMKEGFVNAGVSQTTNAQFISGGWKTDGTTYDIELSGSTQYAISGVGSYNVRGLGGVLSFSSVDNQITATNNTADKVTWTSVQPDASGNFTFYFGIITGQQAALLNYIIIRKH